MSILRVANLQFNASGTRRIDYDAVADDGIINISAAAVKLPVGDTASRPTSQAGIVRYNSDTGYMEFGGATSWVPVASNVAFDVANAAFASANNVAPQVTPAFVTANLAYTTTNASYGFANSAYASINSNWTVTNTIYGVANTALQNTSGVSFNGNFYVPSGNVGIGTNSPQFKLDAVGKSRIGYQVSQGIPNSTDITANAHTLLGGTGGNYLAIGQYDGSATYAQWIQSSYQNPTTATYNLILNPLGGNVGIGVTSPSGKLDVASRGITKGSMPAGSILQVVSVTDRQQSSYTTVDIGTNTNYGYNEAGFDLTTLDIALTPTSTSSKIFILTNINLGSWDQQYGVMRLKRGIGGATPTWSSSDPWMSAGNAVPGTATQLGSYIVTNRATGWQATHIHFQWLDSPNTTSEVKYRFNFRIEADATAATAYLNRAAYNTNDYGSTGAVSSVTLMEVAV